MESATRVPLPFDYSGLQDFARQKAAETVSHAFPPIPPQGIPEDEELFVNEAFDNNNFLINPTWSISKQLVARTYNRMGKASRHDLAVQAAYQNQATAEKPVKTKISAPEPWNGEPRKYRRFLVQCQMNFNAAPHEFRTETAKMSYIGSYLREKAAKWFEAFVDENTGEIRFTTSAELFNALKKGFSDPDEMATANREIRRLKQGTGSVSSYYATFSNYAAILDLQGHMLRYQFDEGLSDNLRRQLSTDVNVPKVFEDYVQHVIELDNKMFAYRQAGNTRPQPHTSAPVKKPYNSPSERLAVSGTHPGPMDTSAFRSKLSPEEKARRSANKLCNYCASDKHFVKECPLLPPKSKNQTTARAVKTEDTQSEGGVEIDQALVLYDTEDKSKN
jgi:hypothetical protein